jgi:hypothetical protein
MVSNSCPTVLFCYLCLDPPWLVNLLLTNWIDGRCSYRIRGFCFFPQPTLKFYAIIYANVYIYIYCTYIYICILCICIYIIIYRVVYLWNRSTLKHVDAYQWQWQFLQQHYVDSNFWMILRHICNISTSLRSAKKA